MCDQIPSDGVLEYLDNQIDAASERRAEEMAEKDARIAGLEAENIRLKIQASGAPSGLIDGELHELIAARGRIAELEAALRPFAKCEACRLGRIPPSEQWLYKPSTRKREMRSISFQNVIDARIALGLNTETGDALASTDEPKRGEE